MLKNKCERGEFCQNAQEELREIGKNHDRKWKNEL